MKRYIITSILFLYVIACAQCAEKYKCSVWRSSNLISVDYTGACSVMEHLLFLRYEDFNAFVLPLSDSISVASCERTIIYTNGFKKVERDCSRTFSPPIRSKWFFVSKISYK